MSTVLTVQMKALRKMRPGPGAALESVPVPALGANDVLVVLRDGEERLIPFVQGPFVKNVDLAEGVITVDWDPEF